MSLLTCRHLSVSYDGKAVLSDLNFSVDEGDYLGIVGENGAGKSTLVKALLRLKKISGGEIVTADGFKPTEIGYLPQQTPIPSPAHYCLRQKRSRPTHSRRSAPLLSDRLPWQPHRLPAHDHRWHRHYYSFHHCCCPSRKRNELSQHQRQLLPLSTVPR